MWFKIILDDKSHLELKSDISKILKDNNNNDFKKLWEMKPLVQPKIKMFGKLIFMTPWVLK